MPARLLKGITVKDPTVALPASLPTSHPGPGGWLLLILLWVPLVMRLQTAWSLDAELAHGWAVPMLAGYLFWQRGRTAGAQSGTAPSVSTRRWGGGMLFVGWVGVWIVIPVLEVNPLWPSAQWLGGGLAMMGTFGVLVRGGGWRVATNFAAPILFLHTALAWPTMLRVPVVNALTGWNAEWAAEIVSLLGHPAVVQGRIIQVDTGLIGVEEACSGLRSLQAVWMFALFFGELHLLRLIARLRVIGVALAAAFAGNVIRTIFLTWTISRDGPAAGEAWHDSAGTVVLGFTLAVVFSYALWESRGEKVTSRPEVRSIFGWGRVSRPVALTAVASVAALEIGLQIWFGLPTPAAGSAHWRFNAVPPEWVTVPIAPYVQETLMCTSAEQMRLEQAFGNAAATAMIFRWENDAHALSVATNSHDPTICMPSIGGQLVATPAPVELTVAGRTLVFDAYRFATGGRTQIVFNLVWDAWAGRSWSRDDKSVSQVAERLRRVREGRHTADRDRLIFVLQGDFSNETAAAWLRELAPAVLAPVPLAPTET